VSTTPIREALIRIPTDGVTLEGKLAVSSKAQGIVLFAHGSGSSRHSPRNNYMAAVLQEEGLATLLLDLLTIDEEEIDIQTRRLRFDIPLLARRLTSAADWLTQEPLTGGLKIGCFGASTGAAAALITAAERPELVAAVVSRGGRPDLAKHALHKVRAPSLFIVGGRDEAVLELNRQALAAMECEKHLEIVPGATHLFEEPGALEQAARLAAEWLLCHLTI